MEDFASAAMMRLVCAGLVRQGIAPPPGPRHGGAHVPQSAKRAALEAVLQAHGPGAILRIADAVPGMPTEPVAQALLLAQDVPDLMDRWARLERFSHGRHRVRVTSEGDGVLHLLHVAPNQGPPPGTAETLLVMAVLAVLSEGLAGKALTFGPAGGSPWREGGRWTGSAGEASGVAFRLAGWNSASASGADRIVVNRASARLDSLRKALAKDPVRRWTLADLAGASGRSPRSLQRDLATEATSFSQLVAETRLQTAAVVLCQATGPGLAEIGFLAGYADQAHFTRSFSRGVGISPKAYRAEFAC